MNHNPASDGLLAAINAADLLTDPETLRGWENIPLPNTHTAIFATPEGEQFIRFTAEYWSLVQQCADDLGWTLIRTE